MHSIVYCSYCPSSLQQTFQPNEQRDISQNLINADEYTIPHSGNELVKKALLFRLPFKWNALTDVKLQPNEITFEIALKKTPSLNSPLKLYTFIYGEE
jgi:hypothetical protein